jgi:ribonucleoside-diphosphate reductase alpha chain
LVQTTEENKILNCENEWAESQYIVNAKVPSMWVSNEHFIDKIDMVAHNSVYDRDLEIVDHKLKVLNKNTKNRSGKYDKRINDVNNIVENDVEMAEFFGEYLANGNIDGNSTVRITINSDKIDKINTIKNIVDSHFGIECCIQNSNHGNWVTIRIESPLIVNMIVGIFGKTFYNKRLPKWIANAPHDYKEALFNGIMSDGHTFENGSKNIVLANPTLVYETMLLGRELGYKANFTSDCMNKLSKSPTSKAIFGDVSYINNVVKEENIPLEVFDIEVEDDHSFVAGDFIVHNCFVLPIDDDMASIGETLKNAMLVHKSGGGTGFNFGNLRPKGALIESTKGESSGPISFMKVYDSATNAVLQGGKRRGANMGILPVWHDDVEEFIDCKKVEGEIANFNISVMIDDDFMKSALCSELYNGKDADAILNHIAQNAWNNGEPGIAFYDTINADNSNLHLGDICATNPCNLLCMA